MKIKQLINGLLILAILICSQTSVWASTNHAPAFQEEVVVQWNRVLMETVLTPGAHPATIMPVRSYSIMHAAIFDAVNSIEGSHTPYLTDVPGSQHVSIEAAAAQAAHDVLVEVVLLDDRARPNPLQQFVLRDRPPTLLDQHQQQVKRLRRQLERLAITQ